MHEIDRFWSFLSTARPYREYKEPFTPYSRSPVLASPSIVINIFNHRINMGLIGWRILSYTLREPRMAVITWTIFTRLMARCGFLSVFSKLHYFQHSLICLLVYNWGLAPKVIATATNEDLTWAASLEVADIFDVAGLICPSLYYVIYCGK